MFFPCFRIGSDMAENFFFFFLKYYICVRRNIFIRGGKIFLLVYFVNLIFGNTRIFFIIITIISIRFWNREDSFLFLLYIYIYICIFDL